MGTFLRLAILALFVWLVWFLIRKLLKKAGSALQSPYQGHRQESPINHQTMVNCRQCGVHLPVSEAYKKDSYYYCNEHMPRG